MTSKLPISVTHPDLAKRVIQILIFDWINASTAACSKRTSFPIRIEGILPIRARCNTYAGVTRSKSATSLASSNFSSLSTKLKLLQSVNIRLRLVIKGMLKLVGEDSAP